MEGRGFRDRHHEFETLGIAVVGAGFTSVSGHLNWTLADGLPFELWTDGERILATAYGAVTSDKQEFPDRIAVLLDSKGTLVLEYRDSPEDGVDPGAILDDLYQLYGD